MTFSTSMKHALRLITLDERAVSDLSKDREATGWGLLIIVIAGILGGLSMVLYTRFIPQNVLAGYVQKYSIIGNPIMLLLFTFIGIAILFLLARLSGGKGSFVRYYRPFSHIYILNWLVIIPFIGPLLSALAGIWQIIQAVIITKVSMQLSQGKAIVVVLLPFIIVFILSVVMALVFWGMFLTWFWTVSPQGMMTG